MLETAKYVRKPLFIQAVQVTDENMEQVAKWCGGVLETVPSRKNPEKIDTYIKVPVSRPAHPRQTQAFVRDWVLVTGASYKVYTAKAFKEQFLPATPEFDPVMI